jgi:LiaF transmembrane domain
MTSARSIRWGLFFISAGVFWLLVENDIIDSNVFLYALSLWPLLLIAVGIEMIFNRTKLKALSYLSPALLGLALTAVAVEAYHVERGDNPMYQSSFSRNLNTGVETLRASVELGDYDLFVRARSGEKVRGKMVGAHSTPNVSFSQDASGAELTVTDDDNWFSWGGRGWPLLMTSSRFHSSREPEYRLDIPENVALDLTLSGSDSFAELDLSHALLGELLADLDEVELKLKIGANVPVVNVTLSGADNQLILLFPSGGGVRIDGNGITSDLSGYLSGKGLVQDGEAFITPGFDTLTPQVRLRVDDDLPRLRLSAYDFK